MCAFAKQKFRCKLAPKKLTYWEAECARLTKDFAELKRSPSAATTQTVNAYETKLSEARQAVDELKAKASERDSLFADKVRTENQLLFEQRQMQIRLENATNESDRLTSQTSELRMQLKETLVTNEAQKNELQQLHNGSSATT